MSRFVYSAFLFLILPLAPLKLLWRGIRQPEYLKYWSERFGFYKLSVNKPVIWLHCVSVGETRAAAPLIDALKAAYPQHQILLTHGTPTGRQAGEQLFGEGAQRVYLPYDLPFAMNGFLNHFKPAIGLLVETELWFNLISACKKRNIPLLLVSARMSEKSAAAYAKIASLVREGLQNLSAIAAQSEADASRLSQLGARNVTVAGNLKFDVKAPADSLNKGLALRKILGEKRTVFLAASTREGEEALILNAVKDLNILTIIVPRHPQRFDEVAALIESRNLKYVRRSNLSPDAKQHVSIILGDSMGELFTYYSACDFTFIGGSLLKFGGQNLIEAASMSKPILIGPYTFNFADATKNAIQAGAAILVEDVDELREKIQLLQHSAAKREKMCNAALRYSQASTGTSARMLQMVKEYLTD